MGEGAGLMRLRAIIACVTAALASRAQAGDPFLSATTGDLLSQTGNARGASWADVDGDGDLDLYVTSWQTRSYLFLNIGGAFFVDATSGGRTADLDRDLVVSASDLALLLGAWGAAGVPADLDESGAVDSADLAFMLGQWGPITLGPLAFPTMYSQMGRAVWGDYNSDGHIDVYIAGSQGCVLFRNEGNLVFTDVTSVPMASGRICRAAAWGEADNDGDIDLYLSCHGGSDENIFFRNYNFDDLFLAFTPPPLNDTGVGRGMAWADYDNDGDQDLYLANGHQGIPGVPIGPRTNRMFRNVGNGQFVDATLGPLGDTGNGRGVAWGDYDNDGDLDLYIANLKVEGVGGENRLLRNDGDGAFTDVTVGELGTDKQSRDCSWIDYDNDADLDLFVVNAFDTHMLFRNDGPGGFFLLPVGALTVDSSDANSAAWADYDFDGDLDAYIARAGALSRLYRNDLDNGNHWLEVRLTGVRSNRSGIGARITVEAGGVRQIREVQSGSGYMTQHMLIAHFGLGAASIIDSIEVRWPGAETQRLENVPANQLIDIVEE